jgi:uncharacterized protein YgiM (DUF1202 family)
MVKLPSKVILRVLLLSVCVFGLVLGAAAAAAAPSQQAQFVNPRLVVNTSFLNIRTGPGVQYSVLVTVVGGTELPVLARGSDNVWYQVATVVGAGWVNVEFTVPRGSFDAVPVVNVNEVGRFGAVSGIAPLSLALPAAGLGQGGAAAPVIASGAAANPVSRPSLGQPIRIEFDKGSRVTSVRPGERFRITINVEAVNVRSSPETEASPLGIVFRDFSNDYTLVNSARDKQGQEWFAIDVPDVGTGWIEAAKVNVRLSRVAGPVSRVLWQTVAITEGPGGGGGNLPILTVGDEVFVVGLSTDGKFILIETGGGLRGYMPFESLTNRDDTPTDRIDLTGIARTPSSGAPVAVPPVVPGLGQGGGAIVGQPSFGLDVPHVVINTGFLNVRSGPGAQYSIVATVPGGTRLPVLGVTADQVWYLVQGVFGQGWVNAQFTLFRGSFNAIPIIRETTGLIASPVVTIPSAITVYAAPGTNFGAIGTIVGPVDLPIVARTFDSQWLQVNTSLGFGWVLASQVIIRGDLSLVPIVNI